MNHYPARLVVALLLAILPAGAETVKDRQGAVLEDRAKMEKDARWIYDDIPRGLAEAKWKGKPVLVVLRCVPCLACAGIDASVLTEPALAPLLDQFVCVRVINANALDLTLFQFDYDLSFSTLILNSDGTLYGRYGSWTHQKNPLDKTTASYQRALEAALVLHRQYPTNKAALAGKQGAPTPFKNTLDIPELAAKYKRQLDWDGKVVASCVHCHQIGDALRAIPRAQKKPVPMELIYPQPAPETIGFTLEPDRAATVASVAAGSIAARAGFQPGDELVTLDGQPPISSADVSWALHRAPDSGSLRAVVARGGRERTLEVLLPSGWRTKSDIGRRVGTWPMRAMASGGLVLEDLPDGLRRERGLALDALALNVKFVGQYGTHAAAKKAGFNKDDVIVRWADLTQRMTESELIGHALQKTQLGEKVKVTVLRGTERVELLMPMQ
jgi:serine protease Do